MRGMASAIKSLVHVAVFVAGSGVLHAGSFEFQTRTIPPAPWSTLQPVRMELEFRNHGPVPVHVSLWMNGMTRLDRLVENFHMDETTEQNCLGPPPGWCVFSDPRYSPRPELFFQCFATPAVPPGGALTCSFDVIPYPEAAGFRTATLIASPFADPPDATPPSYQPIESQVVFGYGVRQVPSVTSMGAFLLALLLALLAWRLHRDR